MPSEPPGPRDAWFGLGLARRFRREPLTFLPELARAYGDLVGFRLGPFRTYFAFHPDMVHEVLAGRARCFRRWERQTSVLRQWDGNGLVLSEGDFWRRQRRLVQPAFHPRRFAAYGTVMVAATRRLVDRWAREPGRPIEIVSTMTDLTLEIIAKVLFDVDVSQDVRRLGTAVAILSDTAMREMSSLVRLPDWLPLPAKRRKRWAMRHLDEAIRRIIRERRASGVDKGDLLSMLLLAADEEGDGQGMTDEQARDEAMVLFLAGHDTTAAALAWVCYLLARHREVQRRLVAEVRAVLGDRDPTADDVARLPYTEAVIKETLRPYPPAWIWFAREAVQDVDIGGHTIPRGGLVYVTPWVTQRDPRWFAEPERFDPDRFLPGRKEPLPPCAFFPFGAGPRVCVGNAIRSRNEAFRGDRSSRRRTAACGQASASSNCCARSRCPESWVAVDELAAKGNRVLAVAAGPKEKLRLMGLVALHDPPREDSREVLRGLRELGIRVYMVTGDGLATARAVADEIGLEGSACSAEALKHPNADVRANCTVVAGVLPEDKYRLVQTLQRKGHIVGMTGDGVNDAPALRQAEVAVAVANATDVAKAAASLILTRPGLGNVISAVETDRRIHQRLLTYTLNKIIKTFQIALLLSLGLVATGVFVTTPRLILFLLFANDFVTMSLAGDRVRFSPKPDRWDIRALVICGLVLALAWLAFSFGVFFLGRDCFRLDLPQLQTLTFVMLVFTGQAAVFLVRERRHFGHSIPGKWLVLGSIMDVIIVSLLATQGILMSAIATFLVLGVLGAVIVYASALDFLKVRLFSILKML